MEEESRAAVDGEPACSVDGTRLLVSSNRDGVSNPEIYVIGSGVTRLTMQAAIDTSPHW